jgi:light-regulated signal transduction histidine kinase (bacteriophytochrome)
MSRGRVEARDDSGRVTRMIGANLDITERKDAEARIESLNRTLDAKLSQLAHANRDLQSFSSMASHDLHAPLRRIDGFAALLQDSLGSVLSGEQRRYLARLRHNAARMSDLIDDLLKLARSSHAEFSMQSVDLGALIGEVVEEITEACGERDIEWSIGALPGISADRALLKVAFTNLLGNALKFTRKQPVGRIEIGATRSASEHVVFVRDNGVGFDARGNAQQLFVAFRRLHTDPEFEGNGIGLATVHRIVERHGGRLWAESAPGAGATFYVALPQQRPADEPGGGALDA